MNQTPGSDETRSVLRPFEEAPVEPLPPIEPSKVVPVDRAPSLPDTMPSVPDTMPSVPDTMTPEDVIDAPDDAPVEGDVPDLDAAVDERDVPDLDAAVDEDDDFWSPEGPADDSAGDVLVDPTLEESAADDLDDAHAEERHDDDPAARSETVTLPRKPFLIGLGVIGLALVSLLALWQTAGGDGDVTQLAGTDAQPLVDQTDSGDTAGDDGTAPGDDGSGPSDDTTPGDDASPAPDPTASLEAEIAGLNAEIGVLSEELATMPPPALPGRALLRVPVASGSKFVSAAPDATSVSVVSPFGGYANIDATTNIVNASGTISTGGTRSLTTASSVWVTNYADSQLIRVDPVTNSVVATFPFPTPDGLAKYDNQLLVASFDGGFLGKVDPGSGEIVQQVALGGKPTDVAVVGDTAWVVLFDTGELVKVDPIDMSVADRVLVGAGPVGLAVTESGIWVANHEEGTVAQVDAEAVQVVSTVSVGDGPTAVISAWDHIWVTVTDAGTLVQIDPATGAIVTRTSLGGVGLGGGPVGITSAAGSLWIAMDREASVVRVTLPS